MNHVRSRRTAGFYPSVWECLQAEQVFSDTVRWYLPCRDMARAIIIRSALAAVWSAGRCYQEAISQADGPAAVILYDQFRKEVCRQ